MPPIPKLSIIISTLNAAKTLGRCLASIDSQTFRDFEVVIIDGGSTDDTLNVAAPYAKLISHITSGPDTGIYDAWNKALLVARGEWLCFLGADDWLAVIDALASFSKVTTHGDVNFVSSRVELVESKGTPILIVGAQWNDSEMKKFMNVAHPGAWHQRSLFDSFGKFLTSYQLAGDYDFLLRVMPVVRAAFIDRALVAMTLGGISNRRYWLHVKESYIALRQNVVHGNFYAVRFLVRSIVGRCVRLLGFPSSRHA